MPASTGGRFGRRMHAASHSRGHSRVPLKIYTGAAPTAGATFQRLAASPFQYPSSWHPSGKFLAFEEFSPATNYDLMILPVEGDEASGWKPGKPTVFLNTPAVELSPMFSPDGRWIAYQSNES